VVTAAFRHDQRCGPTSSPGVRADAVSTEPSMQVRERVVSETAGPCPGAHGRAAPGPRPSTLVRPWPPHAGVSGAWRSDRLGVPGGGKRATRSPIRRRFDSPVERERGKPVQWGARRHSERRPWRGTPSPVRLAGLPSVHLNPSEWDKPCSTRLPRLVARGYPVAVPGRSVRTTFLRRTVALGNPLEQDLYRRPGRRRRKGGENTARRSTKHRGIGQHTSCVMDVPWSCLDDFAGVLPCSGEVLKAFF
jgi:hypothetical protein